VFTTQKRLSSGVGEDDEAGAVGVCPVGPGGAEGYQAFDLGPLLEGAVGVQVKAGTVVLFQFDVEHDRSYAQHPDGARRQGRGNANRGHSRQSGAGRVGGRAAQREKDLGATRLTLKSIFPTV
jgi:hypothetical protein